MPERLLSKDDVVELTGLSYPTIWSMMRNKQFPRSVIISPQRIGWRESEITAWLEALPRRWLKGDPGSPAPKPKRPTPKKTTSKRKPKPKRPAPKKSKKAKRSGRRK